MNMMLHQWPAEVRTPPAKPSRARLISGAIVVAVHAALLTAVVLWRDNVVRHETPPQPIMVDVLPSAPKQPVVVSGAKLVMPEVPVVATPDIVVDSPRAITVQTPPATGTAIATGGLSKDDYFAHLIAYLDARKRYPPEARRLHIEGVVQIRFRIDREGHVLDYAISGSSGRPILDDEARALIERAQPLPPIPAEWRDTQLSFVVPVEFRLR